MPNAKPSHVVQRATHRFPLSFSEDSRGSALVVGQSMCRSALWNGHTSRLDHQPQRSAHSAVKTRNEVRTRRRGLGLGLGLEVGAAASLGSLTVIVGLTGSALAAGA